MSNSGPEQVTESWKEEVIPMLNFRLNGQDVSVDAPGNATLLSVLSNDLKQAGPKFGCGLSQCGACSVLIDSDPVRACQTQAQAAVGRSVTTLEGLREDGEPNALQRAMIAEQAAQCGYCANGMIIVAQALLDRNPTPTEQDVRSALNGNLCRCGTHNRIVRAVLRAAQEA
ncbi:nicotinate dehydrogenase subunit A [Devosia enhydra]|uniref:Nicotinate dehydrogenase subunit A n=2 Tax=Devosia enhydra TaxID=665118 RepID=A0A1K2HT67_9HYPH|nr:nicotinate dehydrogenase subunit A [Devosia enhydra]